MKTGKQFKFKRQIKENKKTMTNQNKMIRLTINKMRIRKKMIEMKMKIMLRLKSLKLKIQTKTLKVENL